MFDIMLTGFADEIGSRLDQQMRVLKQLGMSWVEMRGVDGKCIVDYSVTEAAEIKKGLMQMASRYRRLVRRLGR